MAWAVDVDSTSTTHSYSPLHSSSAARECCCTVIPLANELFVIQVVMEQERASVMLSASVDLTCRTVRKCSLDNSWQATGSKLTALLVWWYLGTHLSWCTCRRMGNFLWSYASKAPVGIVVLSLEVYWAFDGCSYTVDMLLKELVTTSNLELNQIWINGGTCVFGIWFLMTKYADLSNFSIISQFPCLRSAASRAVLDHCSSSTDICPLSLLAVPWQQWLQHFGDSGSLHAASKVQ